MIFFALLPQNNDEELTVDRRQSKCHQTHRKNKKKNIIHDYKLLNYYYLTIIGLLSFFFLKKSCQKLDSLLHKNWEKLVDDLDNL